MSTTPPEAPIQPERPDPPHHSGPRVTAEDVKDLGRLRRSTTDRRVAGVAGGLARHLDVDPVILRVAFVVMCFFGGAGLLLYGACWLLVPEDDGSEPVISLDDRTRTVALAIVGAIAALALVGDSWGFIDFPWPLLIIGAVVLVVTSGRRGRRNAQPTPPAEPGADSSQHSTYESAAGDTNWQPGYPTTTIGEGGAPSYDYSPPQTPAADYYYAPPPRPRDPRKKGPVLFWFTAALTVLGLGVLGVLDAAGVPVADSAYPALVLATCGVMLVVGAFYGRAGGLIAIGLLAALATAAATAGSEVDGRPVLERPRTPAMVADRYTHQAGELVLDLRDVQNVSALDGETIDLDLKVGRLAVLVPEIVDVVVDARVEGPGAVDVFGDEREGFGSEINDSYPAPEKSEATITIHARVSVGEIEISYSDDGPQVVERLQEERNR